MTMRPSISLRPAMYGRGPAPQLGVAQASPRDEVSRSDFAASLRFSASMLPKDARNDGPLTCPLVRVGAQRSARAPSASLLARRPPQGDQGLLEGGLLDRRIDDNQKEKGSDAVRHVRMLGLCLVAVFALSAIAAGPTLAAKAPEVPWAFYEDCPYENPEVEECFAGITNGGAKGGFFQLRRPSPAEQAHHATRRLPRKKQRNGRHHTPPGGSRR